MLKSTASAALTHSTQSTVFASLHTKSEHEDSLISPPCNSDLLFLEIWVKKIPDGRFYKSLIEIETQCSEIFSTLYFGGGDGANKIPCSIIVR